MEDKGGGMQGRANLSAATHFGRQMRKTRLGHGWSLDDLARETGLNAGHLSRVENGKRPPTDKVALACDKVFPERQGWFHDWYRESRTWSEVPAGFRDWPEYEDIAAALSIWQPGIIHGLLQTEPYTRGLLATGTGATAEQVTERLADRMARQRRVLYRDDPPDALFLVDELALYRCVGSPAIMAEQMEHLLTVAALPNVTMQAVPPVAHAANASGLVIAGDAAYVEHLAGGYVYTGNAATSLARRFDTLRAESRRATETIELVRELGKIWATGVSPLTATRTAGLA
jgi:hypothetical protein